LVVKSPLFFLSLFFKVIRSITLLLSVLEAGKSKIKALEDSAHGENLLCASKTVFANELLFSHKEE
jgi:hypothetical protein